MRKLLAFSQGLVHACGCLGNTLRVDSSVSPAFEPRLSQAAPGLMELAGRFRARSREMAIEERMGRMGET